MTFFAVLSIAGGSRGLAQAGNEQGIKPYGSYHGGDFDVVSVSNGHLELRIPIKDFPQRGGRLGLNFVVRYHNAVWNESKECVPTTSICIYQWQWDEQPGMTFGLEQATPGIANILLNPQANCSPTLSNCYLYAYSLRMPDGTQHPLGNTSGNQYESIDTTAFKADLTSGQETITLSNGTRYTSIYSGNPVMEDANGNQIFLGTTIGDSLGRNIPSGPNASVSDFSGCTGLLPIASASLWNIPGSNGATETFKFCYVSVHIFTNHHFTAFCGQPNQCLQPNGTYSMLQSVVLPNGTAWTFDYSQPDANGINWGDLVKLTFPTGGSISYAWNHGEGCHVVWGPKGSTSGSVMSRSVDANDGNGSQTWHYAGGTVTDPLGNDTVHGFTDLNTSCSLYETSTQYYSGSKSAGTLLKTVSTDYSWSVNPNVPGGTGTLHPPMNVVPIRKTTTWSNGQVRKTELGYDSGFTFVDVYGNQYTGIFGKQTAVNEFDYGSGTAGALLKSTQTGYLWQSPAGSAYLTYNVLNVPSSVAVLDGGNHQVALTNSTYDDLVPTASGISVSFDPNPVNGNVRGNMTSIKHLLNGSAVSTTSCPVAVTNGYLTESKTYLDTGVLSQSTDVCGHASTFQYAATPYNGAYLTSSCDALNHCSTMSYNLNPGLLASVTDPNNQTTGHSYDNIGRLTNISYPDGGQTNIYYPDPTTVEVKKLMDPSASTWIDQFTYFDGILRPKQTRLVDPEGDVYTETTYDPVGRVATVSNPHRATSAPTDGITTKSYDIFGRVTSVTEPDLNVIQTAYADPSVLTLTDETGRQRRETKDALERLIQVDEPGDSSTGSAASGGVIIGGTLQTKPATNGTPGTGSVTINGKEQSQQVQTQPGSSGSGSFTITGSERSTVKVICTRTCTSQTIYDTGTLIITVNGFTTSAPYGQGSTTSSVASALAGALNGNGGVSASASGSTVIMTALAVGASTNYSWTVSSATDQPANFSGTSFPVSPGSGALSGGQDPVFNTVYDSGTCSVTLNGTTYSTAFGQGDNTGSIASRLASAISNGGLASASASGGVVSLTATATGTASNYSLTSSCSYNSSIFSSPSFTANPSGSSLTGGASGSPAATDIGTVQISVGGYTAAANYGASADSTASAVASDLIAQIRAQLPTSNPPFTIGGTGASININWNSPSAAGNVPLTTISTTTQTAYFSTPSFAGCAITANPQNCSTSLTGGVDPQPSSLNQPYSTYYTYDLLNNLLSVSQHGNTSDPSQWRSRNAQYDSLSHLIQSNNPEAGQLNYTYDAAGNPITRTDGRGMIVTNTYDVLNRLTQTTYSDGQTPGDHFLYDVTNGWGSPAAPGTNVVGRLSVAYTDGSPMTGSIFGYDAMGRVTMNNQCLPSDCGSSNYPVSAVYDKIGNVTSVTYPSGRTIAVGYNTAGRATSLQLSSFAGQTINYPYYAVPQGTTPSTWGYNPGGSLRTGAFGNGVQETYGYNSRLQLNAITAASSIQTWLSKTYGLYDSNSHNNGDIYSITDGLSAGRNQFYAYDALSRVISGYQQDGSFNQTFSYDPWGNMKVTGTNNFTPNYDGNNRILGAGSNCTAAATYCYDPAGNLLNDAFHQYAYDADNRIKSVDSTGATYAYGANGARVRQDTGGAGTEYVYFAGAPIAERDATSGNWSDYIFFNGRRIARAANFEHQLHISGIMCSGCTGQSYQYQFSNIGTLAGRTVQAGDTLRWLQWQNPGSSGGIVIVFSDGTTTSSLGFADQNGEALFKSNASNQWDYRSASLSAAAGKTISQVSLYLDGTTLAGQWDIYYQDMAFTGADGTVVPLFSQNPAVPGLTGSGSSGITQTSATIHDCIGTGCAPINTTLYYHDDQIGSARLLTAGHGYPVWQGTFTPFGQEVSPQITTNHYKFTGKERGSDAEGGLDYFGARYYSSIMGRWMTPDWSDAPIAVPYAKLADPQSLNLYSYVTDDPLSNTDLDGHAQYAAASEDGSCSGGGDSCGESKEAARHEVTLDEAKKIVKQADKSDSFSTATSVLNSLHSGDTVKGSVLQDAIKANGVQLDPTTSAILSKADSISKDGNTITIQNKEATTVIAAAPKDKDGKPMKDKDGKPLQDQHIHLDKNVSFEVGKGSMTNIKGMTDQAGGKGVTKTIDSMKVATQDKQQGLAVHGHWGWFTGDQFTPFENH